MGGSRSSSTPWAAVLGGWRRVAIHLPIYSAASLHQFDRVRSFRSVLLVSKRPRTALYHPRRGHVRLLKARPACRDRDDGPHPSSLASSVEGPMYLWSERPAARIRQIVADVATLIWVAFWVSIGVSLYAFLAQLAGAGRFMSDSGAGLRGLGERVGGALQAIPLVGEGVADGVRTGFTDVASPMIRFGGDLERLLVFVAALLGLLLAAVAIVPWMNRYLPWRIAAW